MDTWYGLGIRVNPPMYSLGFGTGWFFGMLNLSLCTSVTKNIKSSLTANDSPAHTRFPIPNGTNWGIFYNINCII